MKTLFIPLFLTLALFLNTNVSTAADGISKQQAINIATKAHPGRVLAVKRRAGVYKVKTLSKAGKVHVISIDVNSGKIMPRKKSSK